MDQDATAFKDMTLGSPQDDRREFPGQRRVVIGAFVFYAVLHLVISRYVPTVNRWVGALVAVTPVVLVYVLGGAPGTLGSLLFVGVSLLFTAVRNDAGCEVMTLPGMVFGQRTHSVCVVMSPIDWVEEKISG